MRSAIRGAEAKKTASEYFGLYRRRKQMTRLTARAIKYAVDQRRRGMPERDVAAALGASVRHVRRLYAEYRRTGTYHVRGMPDRPHRAATPEEVAAVADAYAERRAGALRTAKLLRGALDISYYKVYRIMREGGMVRPSRARAGRRKWVRYERLYSNALWHVDWHTMRDPRWRGMQLIVYMDDASRCVTAAAMFSEATSENAVLALRQAIKRFGAPATILSDNGKCFVGARSGRGSRAPKGRWTPTLFEAELMDAGIGLINSRPYHPQTNGKLERFFRSLEEEIYHYGSVPEYIEYYNERRLHFSLDIDAHETPLRAFHNRRADEYIRSSDQQWMEREAE